MFLLSGHHKTGVLDFWTLSFSFRFYGMFFKHVIVPYGETRKKFNYLERWLAIVEQRAVTFETCTTYVGYLCSLYCSMSFWVIRYTWAFFRKKIFKNAGLTIMILYQPNLSWGSLWKSIQSTVFSRLFKFRELLWKFNVLPFNRLLEKCFNAL